MAQTQTRLPLIAEVIRAAELPDLYRAELARILNLMCPDVSGY